MEIQEMIIHWEIHVARRFRNRLYSNSCCCCCCCRCRCRCCCCCCCCCCCRCRCRCRCCCCCCCCCWIRSRECLEMDLPPSRNRHLISISAAVSSTATTPIPS